MTSLPIELQADEQVIMRVHRHIIFLFVKLLGVALFGVIPVIILLVLASTVEPELVILAALWGIITLLIGYFLWYRYQHDEWIIINQRLIDSIENAPGYSPLQRGWGMAQGKRIKNGEGVGQGKSHQGRL